MTLSTEYSNDGKQFIIHVKGKFDFGLVQQFRQSYGDLNASTDSVVVDFREAEYIDSCALGMLLNMRKSLGAGDKPIHLVNCRPEIRNILEIARFDKLFHID
ncbi:MAG: anti-sigma factor antagonist [Idiomarina sp.]|nr:anti-sigma factor antagonist [Idiomarina sp.]